MVGQVKSLWRGLRYPLSYIYDVSLEFDRDMVVYIRDPVWSYIYVTVYIRGYIRPQPSHSLMPTRGRGGPVSRGMRRSVFLAVLAALVVQAVSISFDLPSGKVLPPSFIQTRTPRNPHRSPPMCSPPLAGEMFQ